MGACRKLHMKMAFKGFWCIKIGLFTCAVLKSAWFAYGAGDTVGEERLSPQAPPPPVSVTAPVFQAPNTPGRPRVSGTLSLRDAVLTALKNNPLIGAAVAGEKEASARTDQAHADTRPQISISGVLSRASADMPMFFNSVPQIMSSPILRMPDKSSIGTTLMLMFPVYTGGRLSAAVQAAVQSERTAAGTRLTVAQEVALLVRAAYWKALLNRALVDVSREIVRAAEEQVRVSRKKYEVGSVNLADVLRNQAFYAEAVQELVNTQRDAETALVELKTAMGVSLASQIELSDTLRYEPVSETADSALETAMKNRPELFAADAAVQEAEAKKRFAKSSFLPQVYFTAMSDTASVSGGTMKGFGAGLMVSLPLADGGQRKAQVAEAEARLNALKEQYQNAMLQVSQDVANAWLSVQAAEANIRTSEAVVKQAEEQYRISSLRYEAGKAINLEVLDAIAALGRARRNYLEAVYEYNLAKDKLLRAMGVNLRDLPIGEH
ncbi:MAG: TolC family protein [Armatimonadota bacterium]